MSNLLDIEKYNLQLEMTDGQKLVFEQNYTSKKKSVGTAFLLAIFFGADRVYLKQVGLGLFKMLIGNLITFGFWGLIDLFSISRRVNDFNRQVLLEAAAIAKMIK